MSNQVSVYIYSRAVKANTAGLHPIYVRITIQVGPKNDENEGSHRRSPFNK
jgi:hypothetical protein